MEHSTQNKFGTGDLSQILLHGFLVTYNLSVFFFSSSSIQILQQGHILHYLCFLVIYTSSVKSKHDSAVATSLPSNRCPLYLRMLFRSWWHNTDSDWSFPLVLFLELLVCLPVFIIEYLWSELIVYDVQCVACWNLWWNTGCGLL